MFKVLENLAVRQLSVKLASLYGPYLTCHLSLVQSHLLVAIADTIPVLPTFTDVTYVPCIAAKTRRWERWHVGKIHGVSSSSSPS